MEESNVPEGRVLMNLRHGGHAVLVAPEDLAAVGLSALDAVVADEEPIDAGDLEDRTTPFDYALAELTTPEAYEASHLPTDNPEAVVTALRVLGEAMVEQDQEAIEFTGPIPPVYTYWGQFIDHDLTANTDRDTDVSITVPTPEPLPPDDVRAKLRNLREPALNLDPVYGDGPTFEGAEPTTAAAFYDDVKLRVGQVATSGSRPIQGVRIPPIDDLARDLPRAERIAQIGDGRNDENLIIAQFHLAFLRFHNAAVDWVQAYESDQYTGKPELFARARQLTRWHYQWLVVHDYLKTVARPDVVDAVLAGGDARFDPREGEVFMPLEFSVAAFRFGHTMVRGIYDYNRNFGRPGVAGLPEASFVLLFAFTGQGAFGPQPTLAASNDVLPFNWIIEWDRFVDKDSLFEDRFARKIDTFIAPPLGQMLKEGNDAPAPLKALLKHLARRNLLRGYRLSIPTGQAVAQALGIAPLAAEELADEGTPLAGILDLSGFREKTPLWYYVLREAQVRESGRTLGELGSRLICETIIGQVRNDPESYLAGGGAWTPDQGVLLDGRPITSISDFLRFAGVMR